MKYREDKLRSDCGFVKYGGKLRKFKNNREEVMGKEEKELSLEELISSETEKRLNEMEQPDYEFPKKINKVDVIIMIAGIIVSAVLIALCMTGVIQ